MPTSTVIESPPTNREGLGVPTIFAFAAIYILWGSTFFAIRVAVAEIPPLFAAGVRFTIAGVALFLWAWARGAARPTLLQWRNAAVLGFTMFLVGYACLFWAEKSVPSGVASVLVAMIPIWTTGFEVFVSKREAWSGRLILAVLTGLAGVVLLTSDTVSRHAALLPCLAILLSGLSWAVGTVSSKTLSLPESKPMSAGAQMMIGGVLLLVCSLFFREVPPFPKATPAAILALGYLIVAGSIVAFTAYIWLLSRFPATKVASYAYVNPVVALALGHWLGNEVLTWKTFVAAGLILASVATILKTRATH
jgi:drug/metabolite transporter (DMT)-like permease